VGRLQEVQARTTFFDTDAFGLWQGRQIFLIGVGESDHTTNGGFVTGGGWINSPSGAYVASPTLTGRDNFDFVSKYQKGATVPTGQTQFQFQVANLNFQSTSYQWLVISGCKAQYKGSGTQRDTATRLRYGFVRTHKPFSVDVSKHLAGFFKGEPRPARTELCGVAVAEIAQEVGFDLAFAEKLLRCALASFARAEEFFVQPVVVEARHGTAIQTQGARRKHEVGALERRIAPGGGLQQLRIVLEKLGHPGIMWEELR
jgi:hypothetical protein